MKIQKSQVDDITELLNQAYDEIYQELTNFREFSTPYLTAGLMEINKPYLDAKIATVTDLLKQLKSLKEFNPKKPYRR